MEVFLTSPWVPPEWIKAHGLEPRGVWSIARSSSCAVPEGVCAFAQEAVQLATARSHTFVFTTACDQMRRAADAAAATAGARLFLFNLPATWQSPASRILFRAELARLGRFLQSLGGRHPNDEQLAAIMREFDARRDALRRRILQSPHWDAGKAMALRFVEFMSPRSEGGSSAGLPSEPSHSPGSTISPNLAAVAPKVRLALAGGPLLPWQWPVFDAIDAAGACVVVNGVEPGERNLLPHFPEIASGESPLEVLANHYFDQAIDVFHRPNSRLYAWLRPRLVERGVQGIVLWVHVNCDLWRAEAEGFRESFGLPVLVLDAHEGIAGGLRDANRLSAFIESLRHSVEPVSSHAAKACVPDPWPAP